jgi:osmotically inducible protein OsmC
MPVESRADATWNGDLINGTGHVRPASGAFPELQLTWRQRAESRESGTSPEELLAAAHSACFSMALALGLAQAGHPAEQLETSARVAFQAGEGVTGVQLSVRGRVPGLDAEGFQQAAETAEATCPISKALGGTRITLAEATLD